VPLLDFDKYASAEHILSSENTFYTKRTQLTIRVGRCRCWTLTSTLISVTATPLLPWSCLPSSPSSCKQEGQAKRRSTVFTTPSLLLCLYYPVITTPSLLPCLYYSIFTTLSLLPCHYYSVISTPSLLLCLWRRDASRTSCVA